MQAYMINDWIIFDMNGQSREMPSKLEEIIQEKGETYDLKTQRIYSENKVLLIIRKSGCTVYTVLFDHKGNDLQYNEFALASAE